MSNIYVLCGAPASGKTTVSKQLVKQHSAKLHCYDNLKNAHSPKLEKLIHKRMWQAISEDLSNGHNVVCDDLHIKKEWRKNILDALANVECQKILVILTTPLDECLKRNANRVTCLPDFIIHDLYTKFESPTLDEGWDEIIYI